MFWREAVWIVTSLDSEASIHSTWGAGVSLKTTISRKTTTKMDLSSTAPFTQDKKAHQHLTYVCSGKKNGIISIQSQVK